MISIGGNPSSTENYHISECVEWTYRYSFSSSFIFHLCLFRLYIDRSNHSVKLYFHHTCFKVQYNTYSKNTYVHSRKFVNHTLYTQNNVVVTLRRLLGPVSIWRSSSPSMGIPNITIRRQRDRLIFNRMIPILVRRHPYIDTRLWIRKYTSGCIH